MTQTPVPAKGLEINASRQFTSWLFTKSQFSLHHLSGGKGIFHRFTTDKRLSVFERTFERCMGLYAEKAVYEFAVSTVAV